MATAPTENLGETLVPVVNRLQDIFSQARASSADPSWQGWRRHRDTIFGSQVTLDFKLELPQVAVIGSQSSGKSSVLEALVSQEQCRVRLCSAQRFSLHLHRLGVTSCRAGLRSAHGGLSCCSWWACLTVHVLFLLPSHLISCGCMHAGQSCRQRQCPIWRVSAPPRQAACLQWLSTHKQTANKADDSRQKVHGLRADQAGDPAGDGQPGRRQQGHLQHAHPLEDLQPQRPVSSELQGHEATLTCECRWIRHNRRAVHWQAACSWQQTAPKRLPAACAVAH